MFSSHSKAKTIALLGLVAALSMVFATVEWTANPSPALGGEPEKPTFFGMATLDFQTDLPRFQEGTGRYPAMLQDFYRLESPWAESSWTLRSSKLSEYGTALYLEVFTDDLPALAVGGRDAEVAHLIDAVQAQFDAYPNFRLLVAPLPEMNLPEHAWGKQPDEFRTAYRRIQASFRDAGLGPDRVRFVFAVNGPGHQNAYSEFYPGDDVVDIVGFSKINRNDPWLDYEEVFQRFIDQMREQVTRVKPILATQTASVVEDGDRDAWLRDMFRNLAAHDQVIGALYFNRDKFEGGKQNDYRIVTDDGVDSVVVAESSSWSGPSEISWIFDGSMDDWVEARADQVGFDDISGHPFQDDIIWLADQEITAGCETYRFCPDQPVTRAQMASFIVRATQLPPTANDYFDDDDGTTHEANIDALAASGVTLGCSTGRYCPDDTVTRAQMASFLVRAFDLPETEQDFFGDDTGSTHEESINRLAASGVTFGCEDGVFCPDGPVTRGQMAAFLFRSGTK